MIREGDAAPDFELPDHRGKTISLHSLRGLCVVLCFYPKNRLFGCPSKKVYKMARGMIAEYPQIRSAGAEVFAISSDTVADQAKFVREWNIPYAHLSDATKETCRTYAGLNMARLAKRSTFVIGPQGKVARILRNIDVSTHGVDVLNAVQSIVSR